MDAAVPGRVERIVNIHNPSIEVHLAGAGNNTGTAIILVARRRSHHLVRRDRRHRPVPYFFEYGVNTVILRNRLKRDGYDPKTDEVYDLQQAIRIVGPMPRNGISIRTRSVSWAFPPAPNDDGGGDSNMRVRQQERRRRRPSVGLSSRPDFVGAIYPGPSLFTKGGTPPNPEGRAAVLHRVCGLQDKVHAVWATNISPPC